MSKQLPLGKKRAGEGQLGISKKKVKSVEVRRSSAAPEALPRWFDQPAVPARCGRSRRPGGAA